MVLYARSDIDRVALGELGCGKVHNRPYKPAQTDDDGNVIKDAEPMPVWGIECPPCERSLNNDVHWSKTRHRIPMTPDQEIEMKEAKELAAATLERTQILAAQAAAEAARAARGNLDDTDPADIAITGAEADDEPSVNEEGISDESRAADYAALTKLELKDLARERNLVVGGTREDLISRHVEHDKKQG